MGDSTHPLVPTVTLVYTLSVVAGVTAVDPVDPTGPNPQDPNVLSGSNRLVTVAPTFSGGLLTVSLAGGRGPYGYALLGTPAGFAVDAGDGGVVGVGEWRTFGGDDGDGDGAGDGWAGAARLIRR